MMTLLLDNYDSFSRILFQYLWEINGEKPIFIHNDEWTLERVRGSRFDNIVISPGPGHPGNPGDFGICADVIRAFPEVPILGVCLGLQGMGLSAGAKVIPAPAVRHGKPSPILHDGRGLFAGLPQAFQAIRYHSLVIDSEAAESAVPGLVITARSGDDGQIMGIRLAERPCFGVQFHPESIGTEHGMALLRNFRDITVAHWRNRPSKSPSATPVIESPAAKPDPSSPVRPAMRVLEALELPWRDPEAAYIRFFRGSPAAFWLDSLSEPVPGESRVSYMGSGSRILEIRGTEILTLEKSGAAGFTPIEKTTGDPFAFLGDLLRRAQPCVLPAEKAFSVSFLGGLVGWFGYGLKRYSGPIPEGSKGARVGPSAATAGALPDAVFLVPERMLAFDQAAGKVIAFVGRGPEGAETASPEARAWLASVAAAWEGLEAPATRLERVDPANADPVPDLRLDWKPSASKSEYLARIRSLQEAILRGETYEACLTNEMRVAADTDPFEVYRLLRRTNPAPYAAYLHFPQADILSASPERFLKLDSKGNLACRPIKGTRRRGRTPEEDAALRDDLALNDKDRSENLMIVDLVRNDFGKVCRVGSVRAPELMKVEEHPTVLQLVSTVTGVLVDGEGAIDAVRACFPGGSMTGAPKLRTMELLEAQEGRERGIFSGAMGYLGWDGAMDLGMVIRTLIAKDGEFRIGCGGAILAESDPEAEFAEAVLKASAPMIAVELARFGAAGGWKTDR